MIPWTKLILWWIALPTLNISRTRNQCSKAHESFKDYWYIATLLLRKVYLVTQHVVTRVAHMTHWAGETQRITNMPPYCWWIILFGLDISHERAGSSPSRDKSFPHLACGKNENIYLGRERFHFNYSKCYMNMWHFKSSDFSCWYFSVCACVCFSVEYRLHKTLFSLFSCWGSSNT